jgi:hypothetical protein
MPPPDEKTPYGASGARIVSGPLKTRSEKVFTAIEGDDEFSVASVDPDLRKPSVDLSPNATSGKVQATQDERKLWRLFRKIFS